MSTQYGIFSDESEDYTGDNAIVAQFYSREEAEEELARMRAEAIDNRIMEPDEDDNMYVHECEEPEDEEEDEEENEDEDQDDESESEEE